MVEHRGRRSSSIFCIVLAAIVAAAASLLSASATLAASDRVVVYAFTSRIKQVEKAFESANPGVDVVAVDLASTKLMARLIAEQNAGRFAVDVIYVADAPVVIDRLLREGRVEPYIPATAVRSLRPEHRSPLLAHRLSTKVLLYNEALHPEGSPVRNLWELTMPAFKRRVVFVDPTQRGDYLDFFTEIVLRADEMATAYEAAFGTPFVASVQSTNAGEAFIRALLQNDPIIVSSTAALNQAIGGADAPRSYVGIGTYSDIRDNKAQGWALRIAAETQPSTGILYPVYLMMARNAPNPDGARALIEFMMGDGSRNGGPGYQPFWMPGEFPTAAEISLQPETLPLRSLAIWPIDPARTADKRDEVLDFLLGLL